MNEKFFERKIFEKKPEPYQAGEKEREIEKKKATEFVRKEWENLTSEYKKKNLKIDEILEEVKNSEESDKKIDEVESDYAPKIERQAELQRIVKTYKDLESFIQEKAKMDLTLFISKNGIEKLGEIKLIHEPLAPGISFIKDEAMDRIDEEMEKMGQELLKKHEGLKKSKVDDRRGLTPSSI